MSRPNELVDLTLVLFYQTDKAYLLGDTGNRDTAQWVPMSGCELNKQIGSEPEEKEGRATGYSRPVWEVTMESRWAEEKGFG